MYARSERLIELFRQEVSRLLQTVKDPGLSGFVTVTDLELSKDMKTALVYYSLLGSREERESTSLALARCAGYLRHEMRGRLRLKFIPQIEFRYDETPERADRVERILSQIEKEKEKEAYAPPEGPSRKRRARPGRPDDKKL